MAILQLSQIIKTKFYKLHLSAIQISISLSIFGYSSLKPYLFFFFKFAGKRHLPNFEERSNTSFKVFQNPYGPKVEDVAVEFNTWELPKDDRDPVFKNKIEEEIWRLKKKNSF